MHPIQFFIRASLVSMVGAASIGLAFSPAYGADPSSGVNGVHIAASDARFLGSVLNETWDTSHSSASGYIDCMMPASDVDLNVTIAEAHAGPVTLDFDISPYNPKQPPGAGPCWVVEVDGVAESGIVTIGPAVHGISTKSLSPGAHRVRFVQAGNTSGSRRWAPTDPQLSRVTGVTMPAGAVLGPSRRPAAWFLAITDSIGEGYHDINATKNRDGRGSVTNANEAWPAIVGRMLNKSIAGYIISGIGVVHPGTGTPYGALNMGDKSGANDAWDHIFAGVPRPFTTPPDFIMLCVGSNEFATDANVTGHASNVDRSSTDAGFQANIETFIARVRSKPALATTPICISVAFGGFKRTPIQAAVSAYKTAHPGEANLYVFDLAHGSPALTTTDGIDEVALFGGLTKNRPDDRDTIPSSQAPDRTHPYAVATAAIGSINAHAQVATVMAARIKTLLGGGPAPLTGNLAAGSVRVVVGGTLATLTSARAIGGSAPYVYQFQKSTDDGKTWSNVGAAIDNQASTINPIQVVDGQYATGASYRMLVTDVAEPSAQSIANAEAPLPADKR